MADRTLGEGEIAQRLRTDLPRWRLEEGQLRRTYHTYGWKGTLLLVNAIGHLAEAAFHHPEIVASYATVEVRLWTHDAGGITARDLELAGKIEEVITWQPGMEDGALEGTPDDPRHAYIKYD